MRLTGIVLAGGKSSRMGTDKGLLDFRGKKLVQHPLDLLGPYCHEIFISTNNRDYSLFGFPLIKDTLRGKGPVAGLITALGASSGDWNLVVGCDMPFLQPEFIDLLISSAGDYPLHRSGSSGLAGTNRRTVSPLYGRSFPGSRFSGQFQPQENHSGITHFSSSR